MRADFADFAASYAAEDCGAGRVDGSMRFLEGRKGGRKSGRRTVSATGEGGAEPTAIGRQTVLAVFDILGMWLNLADVIKFNVLVFSGKIPNIFG